MRHFAETSNSPRLFASTGFTFERIAAAAAHCAIELPDQQRHRHVNLNQTWQSRVTCTPSPYLGSQYDTQFALDQAFALSPVQMKILELAERTSGTPQAYSDARSRRLAVS